MNWATTNPPRPNQSGRLIVCSMIFSMLIFSPSFHADANSFFLSALRYGKIFFVVRAFDGREGDFLSLA